MSETITFYHNPVSRGRIVHWMLEEVKVKVEHPVHDPAARHGVVVERDRLAHRRLLHRKNSVTRSRNTSSWS